MEKSAKFYQQGDVLIICVDNIPGETSVKADKIVAEGEVTGHMHRILAEDAVVSVDKDGNIFVDAPNGTVLTHDEHNAIDIPAGKFKIGIVREYDPLAEEIRSVAD